MPDVMLWLTKPSEESVPDLEDVGEKVRQLDYVSEVAVGTEGNTVHISFEGARLSRRKSSILSGKLATRSSRLPTEDGRYMELYGIPAFLP